MVSDAVVVFDNLAGKLHCIVLVDPSQPEAYEAGQARLQALRAKLRQSITRAWAWISKGATVPNRPSAPASAARLRAGGQSHQDYILAGDCMQVVISQRMSIPFKAAPIDLYRALRCFNPTPYMSSTSATSTWWGRRRKCWCASRKVWSRSAHRRHPSTRRQRRS